MASDTPEIPRHKTAIRCGDLSRPMKSALQDGFIAPTATVFDYGCGHGQDVEFLAAQGISCGGWDPAFRPDAPKHAADVVNLGYVLNVIEDIDECASTLRQAWDLASDLLIVAALVKEDGRGQAHGKRISKSNENHHSPLRTSRRIWSSQPHCLRLPRTLPLAPCCFSSDKASRHNNAMFSAL